MSPDYRALCKELIYELTRAANGLSNRTANDNHRAWWAKDAYQAADRARIALVQTEPVAPTDEQTFELADNLGIIRGHGGDLHVSLLDLTPFAESVLARYGTPAIQPVPVSERLPGPEELATLVPLMHSGASLCHSEGFYEESDAIGRIADLLEQLMPQAGGATNA